MAKHGSRRNASRSRSRSRRSSSSLSLMNPTGGRFMNPVMADKAWRMVLNTAIISTVAVASGTGLNLALDRFAPTWTPEMKAGSKIAGGLLLGLAIGMIPASPATADRVVAPIAEGVAVGGVASGLQDFYNLYLAARVNAMLAPAARALMPAAQAGLPAGAPANFRSYTPAACGVPGY